MVSLPTDRITAAISSWVSIRSKEVNPPGANWKEKQTLMEIHHLHLNVQTLLPLSIQLDGKEASVAREGGETMRMVSAQKTSFASVLEE